MTTLTFTFKLVYTENVWHISLDSSMTIAQFLTYMNEDAIRQLMNIHDYYHIQIVKAGECGSELAPAIEASYTKTIAHLFHPSNTSFYVRPVHPVTEEFVRRNQYLVMP